MGRDDNDDKPKPFLYVVGHEPISAEDLKAYIQELVGLKKTYGQVAYQARRNEIAALTGCSKGALDADVKAEIKDDEDSVAHDLFEIGMGVEELWHSGGEGFATFDRDGHLEHYKLDHPRFQAYLSKEYGKTNQRDNGKGELVPIYPNKNDLREATYQLNAYALNEGREYDPRLRLNYADGALWLDLGRRDWKCVRITPDGWEVLDRCKAKIIRGTGAKELPVPVKGGDIRDLRRFVNVRDEEAFVLFVGQVVGQYNAFGNYTTTIFCGPAGSAKTTAMRVMRMLVDPHEVMERPFTTVRDLMHGLANHHVQGLENVSAITPELSDAICRLNTGTGYAERKYYHQGVEFQARGHCPVHINGIPEKLAEREDLIDRTVTFAFELISDEERKSADGFKRAFEAAWPKLLGCVLDGVCGALYSRRSFDDDNDAARRGLLGDYNPRFVDHVVWGEAACRTWGFRPGAFSEAYKENQGYAVQHFARHDPICLGISELMSERETWRGPPEKLHSAIKHLAERHVERFERKFPANAAVMGKELARSIGALRKIYGIVVKRVKINGNDNGIDISKVAGGRHFPTADEKPEKQKTEYTENTEEPGDDIFSGSPRN
jgi:hypothetical protein